MQSQEDMLLNRGIRREEKSLRGIGNYRHIGEVYGVACGHTVVVLARVCESIFFLFASSASQLHQSNIKPN